MLRESLQANKSGIGHKLGPTQKEESQEGLNKSKMQIYIYYNNWCKITT